MFTNLKDLLVKSINDSGKKDSVINSLLWNTVVADFKEKKNIDITPYLISIKLRNDTIFIKTSKPIINSEIISIENFILDNISNKLSQIGFKYPNLKIRYK